MKLTILHLSDLHISERSVLPEPEKIVAVLREAAETPDYVLVLLTGDLVFSGRRAEYNHLSVLLEALARQIGEDTSGDCATVVIPGNHDCAFQQDSSVRDLVLERVRAAAGECESEAFLRSCLEVQDEFFRWAQSSGFVPEGSDREHQAWCSESFTKEGKRVSVLSCNTAWMSSLYEQQGHLYFPLAALPTAPHADLVIAALHHPYNWFEASNARHLREAIEGSSDIVFTGHEHEGSAFVRDTTGGPNVHYVEGQVLSDRDTAPRGFNVVHIDLTRAQYQPLVYAWNGERYVTQIPSPEWLPFVKNLRRAGTVMRLTKEFDDFLQDPGAQLTHRAKELRLEDIFVPPNLRRYSRVKGEDGLHREIIESDYGFNRAFDDRRVHFSGPAQCGRTALAKMLHKQATQKGWTPLLIPGGRITRADPRYLSKLVEMEVHRQYERPDPAAFAQLPKEEKVLIVDDFTDSPLNSEARAEVSAWFAQRFEYIFLLGGDLTPIEEFVVDKEAAKALTGFVYYEIMEFGYLLRERLIEKWLSIGRNDTLEREQLMYEVSQAERLVDTVLGKNLVPAHPIFVLVLLQQFEAHTPVDTRSGAYGYFYDILITAALNQTSSLPEDVDAKYTYLAELAWHLFQHKTTELDADEYAAFNSAHWTKYRLNAEMNAFQSELLKARVLMFFDGSIRFNYRYLYYYFIARYMRDNLSDLAVQAGVNYVVENLHREDCANAIIFLTYLSKDRDVIMKVLEASRAVFADVPPCDLDSHVEFLNRLQDRAPDILLPDGDTGEHRKEALRHKDAKAEEERAKSSGRGQSSEQEERLVSDSFQLNRALKSLQIMGQILRNFSGSLPGDLKAELARESFAIGLRTLNMIYHVFEASLPETLTALAAVLCRKLDKVPEADRERVAKEFLFFITEMLCFSMMKRVSTAVGSERLLPTYEDVQRIYDNRATEFIQMLIRLDHCKVFPEKKIKELKESTHRNLFAQTLLRVMVADHFYLFPRPQRVRQRICDLLGMRQQTKMLVAGTTRKRRA
jgi:predicted phosphodiesterase